MDEELEPVLGAPVEPPEDVWAAALSAAVDDPRDAATLAGLVPDADQPPPETATGSAPGDDLDDALGPDSVQQDFLDWDPGDLGPGTEPPPLPTATDDAGSSP